MKERPILFSAQMVRAILDGRKTQTRRIVKHPIPSNIKSVVPYLNKQCNLVYGWSWGTSEKLGAIAELVNMKCPYGEPRNRLWVRETCIITPKHWNDGFMCTHADNEGALRMVQYIATHQDTEGADYYGLKKTPSIHMPRWASRIDLEITGIRVERLQDISEEDAMAEGIYYLGTGLFRDYLQGMDIGIDSAIASYQSLWESINGPGSWDLNPWVWVIEFKLINNKAA